jgi:hypothetical protein
MLGITKDRIKYALGPLSPLVDAWFKFVDIFTWVLTRAVLVLTFFTIFLSYGIILRLISMDPMRRNLNEEDTYWENNTINNKSIKEFNNLY